MNTAFVDATGNDKSQTTGTKQEAQEEVQVSRPQIERPEGPFEHSGETSGWTKEEEVEKKEQE